MQGVKAREILEEQQRVVVQTQRSHFDLDKVLNFEEVDGPKKKLILEEFIKFFFQMVQESRKFRATGQVLESHLKQKLEMPMIILLHFRQLCI